MDTEQTEHAVVAATAPDAKVSLHRPRRREARALRLRDQRHGPRRRAFRRRRGDGLQERSRRSPCVAPAESRSPTRRASWRPSRRCYEALTDPYIEHFHKHGTPGVLELVQLLRRPADQELPVRHQRVSRGHLRGTSRRDPIGAHAHGHGLPGLPGRLWAGRPNPAVAPTGSAPAPSTRPSACSARAATRTTSRQSPRPTSSATELAWTRSRWAPRSPARWRCTSAA